jgi:hypothetical protein
LKYRPFSPHAAGGVKLFKRETKMQSSPVRQWWAMISTRRLAESSLRTCGSPR